MLRSSPFSFDRLHHERIVEDGNEMKIIIARMMMIIVNKIVYLFIVPKMLRKLVCAPRMLCHKWQRRDVIACVLLNIIFFRNLRLHKEILFMIFMLKCYFLLITIFWTFFGAKLSKIFVSSNDIFFFG